VNEIRFRHGEWANPPSDVSAATHVLRRRTPVALWVAAVVVLVLVAGAVGVVIVTKPDTSSPKAVMDTIAADIADWRGIRMRFASPGGAGFDITTDRDGNSRSTVVIAGLSGTDGRPGISGSRIDDASIGNKRITRTDGGPWMRSRTPGGGPDQQPQGGPQWLADRLRGTVWTEEPGRMLDGQRVRVFSAPGHPDYGLVLVTTGGRPRLLGQTTPQLQASGEEPMRVEPADPETLAEIKALEPVAASLPD
jgi:hypothetical protein